MTPSVYLLLNVNQEYEDLNMTIRAGIVGLGRWAQVLINSIHGKSEAIAITAGCTGRKEKARQYCYENNIDLRNNLTDLINDSTLDSIIIATPHEQHADQIIASAEAGKNVFVEKPFTMTKKSAQKALDACAAANVVCALGHNRRFLPNMIRLREMVAADEFGEILHVEANISSPGRNYPADHWRSDPAQCPAGSMTGLGIHMTDALISIMGPIAQVNATSENRLVNGVSSPVTFMTLRFVSGATGVFSTLFQTAPVWFLRTSGNQGWAAILDNHRLATHSIRTSQENIEEFTKTNIERAELEAFASAVKGTNDYPLGSAEALHGVAVLEGILQSVQTCQPVDL